MDLTPKLLTDVEFPLWWRGYKQDDVDEFLERVAAGVAELQQQVAELKERASSAERRLLDRSDEDEIRRTLVLAQRTAEASVAEAREEADRITRAADERAQSLDAEIEERRRTELAALDDARAALQADVDALREFVTHERERLVASLGEQVDWLTTTFAVRDTPPVSSVTAGVDDVDDDDEIAAVAEVDGMDDLVVDDLDDEGHLDVAPTPAEHDPPLSSVSENLAEALRRAGLDEFVADDGETTGQHDAVTEEESEPEWREPLGADDPFLAELRRAVDDSEPLGPRDHEPAASSPDDHGERAHGDDDSGGFLRRRRRA